MNDRNNMKKKSSHERYRDDTTKLQNRIGCVILIIAGLAFYIVVTPSFMAYRNKIKCDIAESDAKAIATYLNENFTVHDLIATQDVEQLISQANITLSGDNTAMITITDPKEPITIQVTDGSGRCPVDYQNATTGWDGNDVYKITTLID